MNPQRDEPLIDACLDEVLGGRTPPDLTERIMQAFAARGGQHSQHSQANQTGQWPQPAPPLAPPVLVAADPSPAAANGHAVVELSRRSPAMPLRKSRGHEVWWMVCGVAVVGAAVSIAAFVSANRQQIAEPPANGPKPSSAVATDGAGDQKANRAKQDPVTRQTPPLVQSPLPPSENPGRVSSQAPRTQIASALPPPAPPPAAVAPPNQRYFDPLPEAEVVSFINAEVARGWTEARVTPSPAATDSEWCRRLFVRMLGRIPTIAELDQFAADKSKDRREKLIQRLLTEEPYVSQYADHWSVVWANILIGRTGGQAASLANREGLEQYLRTALVENKPYDDVVHELLTATGSSRPGAADFNPAVNFLLDGLDKDATLATSRVSRLFLGHQLQCAQCHEHPSQEWSQEQFWAFNSFFRQMQGQKQGTASKLVNVNFPGQGRSSQDGEVYYETPAGLLKSAFPRFIDGTSLPKSGDLAQVDRRGELARLVVESDQLPKALVNRLWSHFFGYGFTRPVDDLGPATTPSHPQLLDQLAQQFAAHDFNLRSAIRWIALSEPFARSSKLTDIASKDMPEAGEVALFSRYYSRQMQAEEVYNSLVQAAQIRKTAASEAAIEKARVDWLSQFSRNMATDDAEEEHHVGGVRQSLIMMNGDLMKQAVSGPQAELVKSVAASNMKFDKKVEHLFLSALSRPPTRQEQSAANTILSSSKGVEQSALEDIWWAILNSNEFILDH
jgi:hypothetical protein